MHMYGEIMAHYFTVIKSSLSQHPDSKLLASDSVSAVVEGHPKDYRKGNPEVVETAPRARPPHGVR